MHSHLRKRRLVRELRPWEASSLMLFQRCVVRARTYTQQHHWIQDVKRESKWEKERDTHKSHTCQYVCVCVVVCPNLTFAHLMVFHIRHGPSSLGVKGWANFKCFIGVFLSLLVYFTNAAIWRHVKAAFIVEVRNMAEVWRRTTSLHITPAEGTSTESSALEPRKKNPWAEAANKGRLVCDEI